VDPFNASKQFPSDLVRVTDSPPWKGTSGRAAGGERDWAVREGLPGERMMTPTLSLQE